MTRIRNSFVMSSEVETSLISILVMARDYNFWIYIVTNRNHSVLYIGVTNRLSRRTWQHREGVKAGFASKYNARNLFTTSIILMFMLPLLANRS